MEFWICSNCSFKSRQNVLVCSKCFSEKLHLIHPTEFKVKEITKVYLPSQSHQFVPYNVLLLEDTYGMLYPKKTMKSYNVDDTYDEFTLNSSFLGSTSVTCLKHKHSMYSTLLKLLKLTFKKTKSTSKSYESIISTTKQIYFPIPDHLFKLTSVERDNYMNAIKDLFQIINELSSNSSVISFIAHDEKQKELFEKKYLKGLPFSVILNSEKNSIKNDLLINFSPVSIGINQKIFDVSNVYSSFDLKSQFSQELHINFMLSIGNLTTIQGLNTEYLDLVTASSNPIVLSLVTSEILCQQQSFTYTCFDVLSGCEIYGENLFALKTNVFDHFQPKPHVPSEKEFDLMQSFVKEHATGWNHEEWISFLEQLNSNLSEEIIGSYLETLKGGEM